MAIAQVPLIDVLIFAPPHPAPPWIWAIGLLVTSAAITYGGLLRFWHKATMPEPTTPADQ